MEGSLGMDMYREIEAQSGIALTVNGQILNDAIVISIELRDERNCLLHWGLGRRHGKSWEIPPRSVWPPDSRPYDHAALQTPFAGQKEPGRIVIRLNQDSGFSDIRFALYYPEEHRWDNNSGQDYRIEIPASRSLESSAQTADLLSRGTAGSEDRHPFAYGIEKVRPLADSIIEKEMSRNSWTLMHRFNLCYELLDQAENNIEAKALIFVWLRYSSLRQLDWQRNYNTKPRELGHALERLTLKLAGIYLREPDDREMTRLILTTLGRGADAQRVRDEVLHIMHRRHIKEVSGHFMEEWHQKLHNNTTADDIVICEAYLEFLRSDGDLGRFYQRLEEDGVTRERLESFDRPIKSHPDFVPHLKNDLIHDFERFLGILKEVHAATDLGTAMHSARYLCDEPLHHVLDFIWEHHGNPATPANVLAAKVTDARRRIKDRLTSGPENEVRDLLFLDLALEDFLRATVESRLNSRTDAEETAKILGIVIENLVYSRNEKALRQSLHVWNRLKEEKNARTDWALKTKSVLENLDQILGSIIDRYYLLLQPKAEFLGEAFQAKAWTIRLFAEEVIRGRLEFALSIVLSHFDPLLRKEAHIGDWQVISRGGGVGTVKAMLSLKSLRHNGLSQPTIIVTDEVVGDEEIPEGAIAILTSDTTDIVSHVSIRARNAHLLFATCHDAKSMEQLKSFDGSLLEVGIDAAGEVFFKEAHEADAKGASPRVRTESVHLRRTGFTAFAVSSRDFTKDNVGGKSINLTRLRGKLTQWIGLPASVALPFGVFEKVLGEAMNREVAAHYHDLVERLGSAAEESPEKTLAELRKAVLQLSAPDNLVSSLGSVMKSEALPWPKDWNGAWMRIKRVWGSKWNDRAYLSRRAMKIPHQDLFMAVLIQNVVEAEYSFVIHTANPVTGNRDEIYAEVVRGLGEALVSNYPGRALSFACDKRTRDPRLLSFPSKGLGLFGSGLIFRSDSNGEDLSHFAGAGLYDSHMLPDPRKVLLDYGDESLLWNDDFRKDLLASIARIGIEVEKAMGNPQDVEGAWDKDRYFVLQTRPQVGLD